MLHGTSLRPLTEHQAKFSFFQLKKVAHVKPQYKTVTVALDIREKRTEKVSHMMHFYSFPLKLLIS